MSNTSTQQTGVQPRHTNPKTTATKQANTRTNEQTNKQHQNKITIERTTKQTNKNKQTEKKTKTKREEQTNVTCFLCARMATPEATPCCPLEKQIKKHIFASRLVLARCMSCVRENIEQHFCNLILISYLCVLNTRCES